MASYKIEVKGKGNSVLLMYRNEKGLKQTIKKIFNEYSRIELMSKVIITLPKKDDIFGEKDEGD